MSNENNIDLKIIYPDNTKFKTKLERINMDEEMRKDIDSGKGFFINEPLDNIKKTLTRSDSIYSEKFTKTMQDPDAYTDRYSCDCKSMQGKNYEGMVCVKCHSRVKFVGEDFKITGWISLNDYAIIHPNLYRVIGKFIGTRIFESIIEPKIDLDGNGNPIQKNSMSILKAKKKRKSSSDSIYSGIGLIEFYNKFDEVLEYFHNKYINNAKKEELYQDIINNRDKIFIHNIPVYSTLLRPFKVDGKKFTFEGTNPIFNMMAKFAAKIRNDSLEVYRNSKYRNIMLWNVQDKYNALYDEVLKICSGKKGVIKNLIGGRCCFISRLVIVPNPTLRVNQVTLSYHALLELMQQTVINILEKTYNIGYNDAYIKFRNAQIKEDPRIKSILENIIKTSDGGIPLLVNRNPTIEYGSIKAMKCVGITDNYTMEMPLQVLDSYSADFDGDTLNIVYILNNDFWRVVQEIFDPRNAMMISRNDGRFDNRFNIFKDMLINSNALMNLGRKNYSNESINKIDKIMSKYIED